MKKSVKLPHSKKFRLTAIVILVLGFAGAFYYYRSTQVMPQATIYFLTDVVLPKAGQKVLVFSPHPDDETIGAGGYIMDCRARKAQVRIVLVTDGNKHNLERRRYGEFKKATAILGVPAKELVFLGYPDGKLKKLIRTGLYLALRNQIRSFDPDFVIYPHPGDHHPDHAVVGEIVQMLLRNDNRKRSDYQYLVHHPRFPQPKRLRPRLYLLPPVRMVSFDKEWRRRLLPPEVEHHKQEAVSCYKTQLRVPFLRSMLLSSVRRNELYAVDRPDDL